jgi:hypothetical protein
MHIAPDSSFVVVAACLVVALAPVACAADEPGPALVAAAPSGRHYFEANDFENAARQLQLETSLAEKSGQAPLEASLRMLVECYSRLADVAGQTWALEKLVTHYPKPQYWSALIARFERHRDFGERLSLDVLRLRRATGTLQGSDGYLALATLAMRSGFPAEANAELGLGFARGILGVGPDAARQRALRDEAARQAAEQRLALDRPQAVQEAAATSNGEALVQLGYAHVTQGDHATGIALIRAGLRKGGIERPQDATMRLGIAYLQAGRKADALQTLSTVTGMHGAADLGHLWYLYALRNSM